MTNITLDGQTLELKYTMNSICELEERAGKGIMKLLSLDQIGYNLIRLLIWTGLKHNNPTLTIENTGDLLESEFKKGTDFSYLIEMAVKALDESGLLSNKKDLEKKR